MGWEIRNYGHKVEKHEEEAEQEEELEAHILKHFRAPPPLFQKALYKLTQILKVFFFLLF